MKALLSGSVLNHNLHDYINYLEDTEHKLTILNHDDVLLVVSYPDRQSQPFPSKIEFLGEI